MTRYSTITLVHGPGSWSGKPVREAGPGSRSGKVVREAGPGRSDFYGELETYILRTWSGKVVREAGPGRWSGKPVREAGELETYSTI